MPPRGGRGQAVDARAIRTRQAVAVAALLVLLILIVVGVHSCTVSAGNDALRSYSDSVDSLIRASNQTGQQFFSVMSGIGGSTNPTTLQSEIESTRVAADKELKQAEGLSAPSQLAQAQTALVYAMKMRRDGLGNVGRKLQPALQASTGSTSVDAIATEMARLYASDVLYKDYALPLIEDVLHSAGIAVGGPNGEPVDTGQFMPNLEWLSPSFVAAELHTTLPSSSAKLAPGTHGHELNSCSVGSSTLSTATATTLPAGAAPTLTCTFTNSGENTETNVVIEASIGGTSIVGQKTVSQTQAGQQYTVQIPLSAAPPNGSYSLTVTVERVPGETNIANNTQVYPVTFG